MSLPADASGKVYVDVETAFDSYGRRLPLISNVPIDNERLTIEWSKGQQQMVILNALDNWKQRATCQFQVTLRGQSQTQRLFSGND
jgi:hypothetical protein